MDAGAYQSVVTFAHKRIAEKVAKGEASIANIPLNKLRFDKRCSNVKSEDVFRLSPQKNNAFYFFINAIL